MADNGTESDEKKNLSFNEESEFSFLEWAINKIIDNDYEFPYQEEFICAYKAVYHISKYNPAGAEKLYEKYQKTLEDYVSSKVLPHLKGKNGEILMTELVNQWNTYSPLKEGLSRLFYSLERYFIQPNQRPSLLKTSHSIFYNMVYTEFEDELRLAFIPNNRNLLLEEKSNMADKNTESDQKKNSSIDEESELSFLEWAINKIIDTNHRLTPEEHIRAYGFVYHMSLKHADAEKMYEKHKKTFRDYASNQVLPHLRGKNGEILLREVIQQWDKYKTSQEKISELFDPLRRFFIQVYMLPSLLKASHSILYNMVCTEFEDQVRFALIPQINLDGNYTEEIDEAAMKKVEEIYEEITRVINEKP